MQAPMESAAADARLLAMPCVLLASALRYLQLAKKPMAAPFQRVTDSCAQRLSLLGGLCELLGLRFLPVSVACPMNVSCLVFLYFWKETKHASGARALLPSLCALAPWALPLAAGAGGAAAGPRLEAEALLAVLLAPLTGALLAGLLGGSVAVQALGPRLLGEGLATTCLPAALHFAASAVLLKVAALAAAGAALAPAQPELWGLLLVLCALAFGVRRAAGAPLQRALELCDNLRVLAVHGACCSLAASAAGALVFGELVAISKEQQMLYVALTAVHAWGLQALGSGAANDRGSRGKDREAPKGDVLGAQGDEAGSGRRSSSGDGSEGRASVEMAARAAAAPAAAAGRGAAARQPGAALAATAGVEASAGPLLAFAERTVDEDAEIEEKLFKRALAGLPAEEIGEGLPAAFGGFDATLTPQFDADFEEIMRRFDEDDRQQASSLDDVGPGVLPIVDLEAAARDEPVAEEPAGPTVLQFDAQTLLDDSMGVGDDEDELLNGIEDMESL